MKKNLPWLIVGALVVVALGLMVYTSISMRRVETKGVRIDVVGVPTEPLLKAFVADTGIVVNPIGINIQDGTTLAMDTMIQSGIIPNVYREFTGRASRYMVQTSKLTAMDMKEYMSKSDLEDFGDLTPWYRDGKLLGVPGPVPLQAMCVNLTLLRKYNIPEPSAEWTVGEFLSLARQLKAAGAYATALFAANPSADYLWVNWFGAFGAEFFKPGDYSKSTINTPAGLATLKWFKMLVDDGYAPKEAPDLWDDAALEIWMKGNVAFMPIRPDWVPAYKDTAKQQKLNEAWFEWKTLPFPKGPGVKSVPTVGAGATTIVFDSGVKAVNAAAIQFALYLTSSKVQIAETEVGNGFASRKSALVDPPKALDPAGWKVVADIKSRAGVMDVGYTLQAYSEMRAELPKRLQAMWRGTETPEEALAKYEAFCNEVLKK